MAARTPRKRKFSSVSSDGRQAFYGTPVKKLIVENSNCPSPLTTRNSSQRNIKKSPPVTSYTDMADLTEKENVGASPLKSSTARKLVVSPTQTAAVPRAVYGNPPLVTSPRPASPFKASVSTRSFYKRDKFYITPLDRKLINESKSSSSSESSMSSPTSPVSSGTSSIKPNKLQPGKRKSCTKSKKTPLGSTKKTAHKPTTSPRTARKAPPNVSACKPTPSPRSVQPTISPQSDKLTNIKGTEVNALPSKTTPEPEETVSILSMKTTFLGLKMKPRPKLTVGAAFFATGKRPHSAPKRSSANIKFPPSAKPVKQNPVPVTKALPPHSVFKGLVCVAEGQKQGQEERRKTCKLHSEAKGGMKPKPAVKEPESSEKVTLGCDDVSQERLPTSPEQSDTGMQQVAPDSPEMGVGEDSPVPKQKQSDKKGPTVFPIFSTPAANKRHLELRDLASPVFSSTPTNGLASLRFPKQGKKKREGKKMAEDQLVIDAGQRHFGAVACTTCGMVYAAANLEDEAQHVQYHQRLLEGIRYVGWKKERVITEFWDGKIIMVSPDDPKYALRKAEEVRELVDSELGFQQVSLRCPSQTRTYMFVSNEKKIIGCLIAEPIREAYRVLAEPPSPHSLHGEPLERHRAWRCSTEPEPAICGISRIWVFALMRRKAIASRMVDAVRSSFMYGSVLTTEEIAFSDPTPDGKLFASTYCKVPDFLVYNFVS